MELISHVMPNNFTIYDLSDLHVGSPNCALDTLRETIELIRRDRNGYIIVKGDAIESILPSDAKRYTNNCVVDEYKSPLEQADKVIELFSPVKRKILAWGQGNHELKLVNTADFSQYMARELGVPYGAYLFIISFHRKNGDLMFKTFHSHGMGSPAKSNAKDDIQREGNKRAGIKQWFMRFHVDDCIYMSRGHCHTLITVEPTVYNKLSITSDGTQLHQSYHVQSAQNDIYIPPDSRWYATTGSFRKSFATPGSGYSDYAEIAGYGPSELGYQKIKVMDGEIVKVEKVVA